MKKWRLRVVVTFALLGAWGMGTYQYGEHQRHRGQNSVATTGTWSIAPSGSTFAPDSPRKRSPKLEAQYAAYNALYFNNRLPHGVEVWFEPLLFAHASVDPSKNIIRIGPAHEDTRIALWFLLHEMCHLAVPLDYDPQHGVEFELVMRRLAKAGAFQGVW